VVNLALFDGENANRHDNGCLPPGEREIGEREREDIIRVCAACSIISVLTQWGATLVIKIREREREREIIDR
jgi:hypothetical protein